MTLRLLNTAHAALTRLHSLLSWATQKVNDARGSVCERATKENLREINTRQVHKDTIFQ